MCGNSVKVAAPGQNRLFAQSKSIKLKCLDTKNTSISSLSNQHTAAKDMVMNLQRQGLDALNTLEGFIFPGD